MDKITFVNGQSPYINATNLNQMQTNAETAINTVNSNALKQPTVSSSVTTGKVVFTITSCQIDQGLTQLSFHSDTTNFGGAILFNIAYTLASSNVINASYHNSSGTSVTYSGNILSGLVITISDSTITASDTFTAKAYRMKNYAGN